MRNSLLFSFINLAKMIHGSVGIYLYTIQGV